MPTTAKTKVIIDTDPGVDDILAHLLAFTAKPEDLEVLLISLTFGNVGVESCLRNIVSLFHIIEREQEWRRANDKPEGFEGLKDRKPIVAMGATEPLAEQKIMADFFHGIDGLGGVHSTHPHLSPAETWRHLFDLPLGPNAVNNPSTSVPASPVDLQTTVKTHHQFTPSTVPSHKLILRLLAESPPNTITIVAIGPLTNLALAAAEDAATFMRAKEVVIMGGAMDHPGNITPLAEFNTHADTIAFARVLALTSPHPKSTMPPWPPGGDTNTHLPGYPTPLPGRLRVRLCSLDITTPHVLSQAMLQRFTKAATNKKGELSPLAEWLTAVLAAAWRKVERSGGLNLHDPIAVWHAFHARNRNGKDGWEVDEGRDIRVETMGQWTRGACIVDRRDWPSLQKCGEVEENLDEEIAKDRGGWLDERKGNRVDNVVGSPVWRKGEEKDEKFAETLLGKVFPQ